MKNKTIKLSLVATLLTTLNLHANDNLGMITVSSATKSEQSIKDVTSNIEVITSIELEEKHYTTATQALNSIAGIDITSNGGLGQGAYVRINGMHYSTTLVLIDGVRYNDITNGSAFLENIMVSDIKQIEVIKGAQSGVWGADASGGVINIITKDATHGLHGSINTEVGSFNTKKYGATASYKDDNYYLKLSGQKITSDGFSAQVPNGDDVDDYEDDSYENTTTSLKTGININDNNKIDIIHTDIDTKLDYDSGAWGSTSEDIANSEIYKSTSNSKFTKINYNNKNQLTDNNIYASNSSFHRKDPEGYTKEFKGEVEEIGVNTNIKYNKNDFLLLGLDKKEFSQEKGYEIDYINNGIFLTNSNTFDTMSDNDTILTQSIRYDTYTSFENKTTGKLGLKHFHNDFTFSTNYGTGYKAPSLYELSHDGGDDLKPEYTKSFDISTKYKGFEIKYFENKIDDLVSYSYNGTPYDYSDDFYENTDGTSTIKGYELNYKKDILDDLFLAINYTKIDAKDKDGKTLGRVPEELLKLSVDYYGIKNTHINVNGEYVGDRWDMNGEPTDGAKTGKYTVVNAVTNYDINKDLKIYLKVDNVTDKYYQTVDGYATSPRAYYIGLNAKF
ncbi:MAG: TonB-dependent receptor [Campylobacterota bacterium]|nr:TonB-dependent receptor [Campylobacterota bacterium]